VFSALPRRVKRLHERLAISAGQRIEQGLIDLKVEHHVHAIAGVTKIFHVGSRKHVGLAKMIASPAAIAETHESGGRGPFRHLDQGTERKTTSRAI
jgi:hypothetical protein